jgi:hypothetical protein
VAQVGYKGDELFAMVTDQKRQLDDVRNRSRRDTTAVDDFEVAGFVQWDKVLMVLAGKVFFNEGETCRSTVDQCVRTDFIERALYYKMATLQ